MSLLGRLLLVVTAAIVPAVAFHAYTANQAIEARRELVRVESLRLLSIVNAEQLRIIEGAERTLDGFNAALEVLGDSPESCHQLLFNVVQQAPRYKNAGVIGLDGRLTCSAMPNTVGTDLSDRTYVQDALRTGHLVVGEYMIGRVAPQPLFVIAKPFRDSLGQISGILEVSLSLEWLGQQLAALPLPDFAHVRIADRNGNLLAALRAPGSVVGRRIPAANDFSLEGDQPGIKAGVTWSGRPLIMAYAPPGRERNRFAIAVSVDPEIAFAGVAKADRMELTLLVAGGVLALALTALLGNQLIRRPATELLRAAENWRSGALHFRTRLKWDRAEFGRIAAALDDMAETLEARKHAVETALESTTDAVLVFNRTWRLTYFNQRALALTDGRDLVGQLFWDEFPQLQGTAFADQCKTAMATGVPARIETPWNESIQHCNVMAYPASGGLTLYIRDITEERRVAAALHDSEGRLDLAREAAGVGFFEFDLATEVAVWSEQKYRLHGLEPGTGGVDYKTFAKTIHPEDQDRMTTTIRSEMIPGRSYGSEFRVVWPNGEVHWLLTRAGVGLHADGQVYRTVGITMDITELKRLEEALRESEGRLQLAQEAAGLGIADLDLVHGAYVWTDQQWRLLGLEPGLEPPTLAIWLSAIHPDDRPAVIALREAAFNDNKITSDREYRVVWPDGSEHWLRVRAKMLLGPDSRPARRIVASFDVTESRENEAALRRLTEELEQRVEQEIAAREAAQARAAQAERMQALGQLAGGIAHDVNNVLQAVSGALTMIDRRTADAGAIHRLVRLGTEATDRGASITRRLLTFGRQAALSVEVVNVPVLLRDLHEMLAPALGALIEMTIGLPETLPGVMADKRQLETVLVNLATTARDAMPAGGRLIIAAESQTVSAPRKPLEPHLEPGCYVRISVTDTGGGMKADILARCREPFFTTKEVGAGTGLGLPMAYSFADQSGGALDVESQPGQGTTVTLWLPVAVAETAAAAEPVIEGASAGAPAPSKALSVLVVDDEATIREIIAEYLEEAGYSVLRADNGANALALIDDGRTVDALITDLTMPGMDGLAVIRAMRERHPRLPCILLTGYAGDDTALALGRSMDGAVAVLRKPVTYVQLLDRLGAILAISGEDESKAVKMVTAVA